MLKQRDDFIQKLNGRFSNVADLNTMHKFGLNWTDKIKFNLKPKFLSYFIL